MPPSPRSAFRERLAYYLLGVGISLILLGFLWSARYQAAQRRRQANQPTTAPAPSGATIPPPSAPAPSVK